MQTDLSNEEKGMVKKMMRSVSVTGQVMKHTIKKIARMTYLVVVFMVNSIPG